MVPEPNLLVVPERGCVMPARGGVGSAAIAAPAVNPASMQAHTMSLERNRSGLCMAGSPEVR